MFEEGWRPVEIARELEANTSTVLKYFGQWKRLGPDYKRACAYLKKLVDPKSPDREHNLELMARGFGIAKEELESILSKPYGIRRLVSGKHYFPVNADADHKMSLALELALFFTDLLTEQGATLEDFKYTFERMVKTSQKRRQQEDSDIKEWNVRVAFIRALIEANAKAEREGRPKQDRLTKEEIQAAIRLGAVTKMYETAKNFEARYWSDIGRLEAEGFSEEQAREKLYQDLVDADNPEAAEMLRRYQDIVHPIKDVTDMEKNPPPDRPPDVKKPENNLGSTNKLS